MVDLWDPRLPFIEVDAKVFDGLFPGYEAQSFGGIFRILLEKQMVSDLLPFNWNFQAKNQFWRNSEE